MDGTIQQKREAADALLADATKIISDAEEAKRPMTAEERTKHDSLNEQYDNLVREIDVAETELRVKLTAKKQEAARKSKTPIPTERPGSGFDGIEEVHNYQNLPGFGEGAEANRRAYHAGKWLIGAITRNEEVQRWARNHGMEYRVATEGINTAGGFLAPVVVENAVIELLGEYGAARRLCRRIQMTSDTHTVPIRVSGQTAYFVAENNAPTDSDKVWNQMTLRAKTLAVESRYSSALSEDAIISIASDLSREAALTLATKEDQCWIDGDGTSTYGGIQGIRAKIISGSLATYAASIKAAPTAAHDTIPEIDMTDLTSAMALLPSYAGANVRWYCSLGYYTGCMVRLAAASTGNTLATMQGGLAKSFLGYPVEIVTAMPGSQTTDYTGLVMAFFGDMSQACVFGERRGITLLTDPYTLGSYLQTKLVWSERFDIITHSLGDATNAGPVIALVGGSG